MFSLENVAVSHPLTSCRVLQYLHDSTWLDEYTQAIFMEFTVYNANVNLFCIVTLMFETSAVGESSIRVQLLHRRMQTLESFTTLVFPPGAFQFHSELRSVRLYQSTGSLHIFVMASEAVYFLFILYYMFVQV